MPPAIYGGALTIGLVRSKLEEHRLREAPLEVVEAGKRMHLGPFELELVHMAHSIPDSRAVVLRTDLGALLITGDYKFDQTPVDGRPADVSRLAELGREGVLVPVRRLDQRRPARGGAVGVERRPRPARPVFPLPRPDHRHLVRLQRASGPAGHRRCRRARSTRGAGGPLDAQELQHRLQPRHRQDSGGHADPGARDRVLSGPRGGRDLDREPGGAAVRAAAHGPRRSRRRRAALRRHRDLLGDPDPRQRALGQRDDRSDLRDRRPGGDRGRRADSRLGPRMAGGAEADAQLDPAALRDADSRRPQAPAPSRRPGRVGGNRAGADLQGPQRPGARVRRVRGPPGSPRSRPG